MHYAHPNTSAMKNLAQLGLAFVLLSSTTHLVGQTVTNKTALLEHAARASSEFQQKKAAALIYAEKNNIPVIIENDSIYMELMSIDDGGIPQYYITNNVISAASISTDKVNTGGGYGYSLDGNGMTAHLWDAGGVLTSHQEFGARVTQIDNPGGTHYHSTHVAGTIIASGVVANAKGMAPAANLNAYDWNNDWSELAAAGANGALVSNHSYGNARGWANGIWYGDPDISDQEDYKFGYYGGTTQDWDRLAYNAPYLLICKSAGNDRNDNGNGTYPPDGPYDCIGAKGVAKMY